MSDYERSTSHTTLAELPEPLRTAVRKCIEDSLLTVPEDAPAFLTRSLRLKRRLLGGDKDREHFTAVVVGPRDVVVGIHGERRGTSTLTARWEDLDTSSRLRDLAAERGLTTDEDGVTLTGFSVSGPDGGARGSFYIGLGHPDADVARVRIADAIRAARGAGGA